MLIREAKQHNALYPIHIKGTENRAELMSKKGQKNIISLLNFWHAAKKALFFSSSFFEGSLTIFLSLSLSEMQKRTKQNKFSNERRSTSQRTDDDAQKKARWRKRRRLYLLGGKIVVVVCFFSMIISIFFFFCRRRCSSFQQRRRCVWRFPRPRPRLIDSIRRKTNSLACVLRNSSPAQGDA